MRRTYTTTCRSWQMMVAPWLTSREYGHPPVDQALDGERLVVELALVHQNVRVIGWPTSAPRVPEPEVASTSGSDSPRCRWNRRRPDEVGDAWKRRLQGRAAPSLRLRRRIPSC